MPNCCKFDMKIVGKEDNVREFIDVLNRDYDKGPHFWKIFNTCICDIERDNGNCAMYVKGNCAWSVYACMQNGPGTYNNNYKDDADNKYPMISLQSESVRLNINIEVFSKEPCIGFEEHYLYNKGVEKINKCVNYEIVKFDRKNIRGNTDEEKFANFIKKIKKSGTKLDKEYTLENLDEDNNLVLREMENWGKFRI